MCVCVSTCQAEEAHRLMESGELIAKTVLEVHDAHAVPSATVLAPPEAVAPTHKHRRAPH